MVRSIADGKPGSWAWVRVLTWVSLSVVWVVVAFLLSIGVAALTERSGNLRYAALAVAWSGIGIVGFIVAARLLGLLRRSGWREVILVISTVAAGTLLVIAYVAWALASYGTLDPNVAQGAVAIPFLAVAVSQWAAAATVVGRTTSMISLSLSSLGMVGLALSAFANLGGLADGLSVEGTAMMVPGTSLTVAWAACCWTVVVRPSASSASSVAGSRHGSVPA